MKKWMIVLICVMLCGCTSGKVSIRQPIVVTRIAASYDSGAIRLQRHYTDDEKLRSVLNYFRGLSPYDSMDEGPAGETSQSQVTVYFSDGSSKVYEQFGNGYLRLDGGIWQKIDPDKGQELAMILGFLESDEKF